MSPTWPHFAPAYLQPNVIALFSVFFLKFYRGSLITLHRYGYEQKCQKKLPSSERAESWGENVRNFLWRQSYKMSENFDIFKISNPQRNHYEYKFRNRQTSQSKRISVLRFLSGQGAAVLQVTSLKVKIKPFPFK